MGRASRLAATARGPSKNATWFRFIWFSAPPRYDDAASGKASQEAAMTDTGFIVIGLVLLVIWIVITPSMNLRIDRT
jgi:hypothetical protein